MDAETIDRLVAEAQAGNREAFGQIFDEYHQPIYRFVVSRVGRPSDAEDLTQLIFVKALEALPRYTARGIPFGGWLFRLARNAVIDHVRTRRDHLELTAEIQRPTEEAGPEATAALRQDLDAVARALGVLTDEPAAIRTRVLRQAALEAGCRATDLTAGHVASVDALVTDWRGQRWIDLPQGIRAIRKGGFIILGPDVTG